MPSSTLSRATSIPARAQSRPSPKRQPSGTSRPKTSERRRIWAYFRLGCEDWGGLCPPCVKIQRGVSRRVWPTAGVPRSEAHERILHLRLFPAGKQGHHFHVCSGIETSQAQENGRALSGADFGRP